MEVIMGNQIQRRRKELHLTQNQLAEQLGVTKQAVSKWENGQCCPDIAVVPELARIFNCSIDALFGLDDTPETVVIREPDTPEIRSVFLTGSETAPSRKVKIEITIAIVILGLTLFVSSLAAACIVSLLPYRQ